MQALPTLRRALPFIILAGCAHHREVALAPPPPPPAIMVEAPPPAPPPLSPMNANLSAAGTVWHLRAALNVAALACRGADGAAITAGYNALLASRKLELNTAYAALNAEFRAGGGDWRDRYDDAMTRLYNFFSAYGARERFCAAAASVLADAGSLAPDALTAFAAERLPLLDAPFATPAEPPAPVIATAAVPRLRLDLSSLADK